MNPTVRKFLVPAAVVALLGLLLAGLLRPSSAPDPMAGQPAPGFTLRSLDGGRISLAQFRGRPVVINFFASWCLPCRDEAPLLRQTAIDRAKDGVVILGIAYSDKEADTRRFRDEFGLGFPVLMDDEEARAAVQYGLSGVPETYFVDRQGQVVRRHKGPVDAAELEAGLKAIL